MKSLIVAAMMVVGISAFGADQVDSWASNEAKVMVESKKAVEKSSREQKGNPQLIERAFSEMSG